MKPNCGVNPQQKKENNMATHKVEVSRKKLKAGIQLPADTIELLKSLPIKERKAYAKMLVDVGWTYNSIATPLGVTRQAVESYVKPKFKNAYKPEALELVKDLPIPQVPTKAIMKAQMVEASAEVVSQLKELHAKAKLVRGKGQNNRAEANELTKLLWEQHQQGISVYSLAKSLGVTPSSIQFRFVRYGYKTTNGKSGAYAKIQYDKGAKENG